MDSAKFKNLTISYFSDCIFISIPFYRDDSKLLYEFIEHLSNASASLFKTSDVLLRGAVTIGKVFHKNTGDPAFGPALIEAYELESNIANYPRIILSSECFGLIRKYSSVSTNPNFTKILKRYSDGCIGTDIVKIWKKNDDLPIDGDNHHKLKKLYTEAIGNTKIFKKIDWLKNEFEKEAGCDLCAMKDNKLFPLIDL
jgi:hypothetical protein